MLESGGLPDNWTIFTCVFGGYDQLRTPTVPQRARLVCFTDKPFTHPDWEIVTIERPHPDPRRAARKFKILAHEYIPGASVWVDTSITIRGDLIQLAETCGDFAMCRHRDRNCAYEEIAACLRRKKDTPAKLNEQFNRYVHAGFPKGLGLYECGLIIRRQSVKVREFCAAWWAEYQRASCRDQPALPFVCWQRNEWPQMIEMNVWDNVYTHVERDRNGVIIHRRQDMERASA